MQSRHWSGPEFWVSRLPWLLPGIALSLVLSIVASGRVAQWLGARRMVAGGLILATGAIISGTLTPLGLESGAEGQAAGSCDLSRLRPANLTELSQLSDEFINVMMLIPLGIAIALIPRSTRRLAILFAALAFPFAIEGTQLVVTQLRRGCESADVIDNLTGLLIGLVLGTFLVSLRPSASASPDPTGPHDEATPPHRA